MTLLPRSLLWRTVLVLGALLVLSQLALFQLFRVTDREPRAQQVATQIASVVNLTRLALVSTEPDKRPALLEDLSRREGIQIYRESPSEAPERPSFEDRPFVHLLRAEVSRRLGKTTELEFRRSPDPSLWVSFQIDDNEYWVVIPRTRIQRPFPWQWAAWAGIVLALSVAGATLIIARINRPLGRLTEAAAQIGRRDPVAPLPECGPSEIRSLARAFNEMAADLSRRDADRALLLAGVSHDLRTPLARLRLGLEMLEDGDAKLKGDMVKDIEDMDTAIGQFLDFARDESAEPPTLGADLNAIVQRAAGRWARSGHPLPRLDLESLPAFPLRVLAMERLIGNLIENAARHGGSDDFSIQTRTADARVVLSVLDRGPGIPPAEADRMLKPFTRLDAARGTRERVSGSRSSTGSHGCTAGASTCFRDRMAAPRLK